MAAATTPADFHRLRKTTLSVLLAAAFVLSALLASSNEDSMAEWLHEDAAPSSPMAIDERRRFLLSDEDRAFEVDPLDGLGRDGGEGAWGRRALRARKDKTKERRRRESQSESWNRLQRESWDRILAMVNSDVPEEGFEDSWQPKRRMAVRVPRYEDKHHFDECVGKTVDECQTLIDVYVGEHPEQFNNQTTLRMELRKIREYTDDSYYKVVLRTDITTTVVNGVFDDGMVSYPWPWTVDREQRLVGPWNCTGKTPADCCYDIQMDVVDRNDYGDLMACFVEEPVGTPMNPERDNRAITVVDSNLVVMRAPIAH